MSNIVCKYFAGSNIPHHVGLEQHEICGSAWVLRKKLQSRMCVIFLQKLDNSNYRKY